MNKTDHKALLTAALSAAQAAYAPYSKFRVGAALLAESGELFTGCNIENASYTPTVCAERTAFFKAVSSGFRKFKAIAVVGGAIGESEGERALWEECFPCGVCRQVMAEFCEPDKFEIIVGTPDSYAVYKLGELLPHAFVL